MPAANATTLQGHFDGFTSTNLDQTKTFHKFTLTDAKVFDPGTMGFLTNPATGANPSAAHGLPPADDAPDSPTTKLTIGSSSAVQLQLTDAFGNELGYDPDSGGNLFEITDGDYSSDPPIANSDGEDPLNPGDTSVLNTLYVPTAPADSVYQLTISATADGPYSVDVLIAGPGHGVKTQTLTGVLTAGQQVTRGIDIPDLPASGTDLAVVGSVSPAQGVRAGGTLTYSFQVTNQGLATATSVTLFDQLSDGATLVSANGSDPAASFTYANSAVQCHLPDMAPGATETINVTATALTSGTLTNVANAAAFETDVAPANNTASTTTTVTDAPSLAPIISSSRYDSVVAGQMYSYQITATNSPTSYGVSGLPDGLTMDPATGLISGTPGEPGVSVVNISAINASGTGTATLLLTVVANSAVPIPVITGAANASAQINLPFTYQITASNSPTAYAASGLPVGLSIDADSGLISGTLTATGVYTVGLTATNAGGSGNATLTLTLVAPTVNVMAGGIAVEGGAKGTVVVTRTGDTSAPLTVAYKVKGTAAAGVDYKKLPGAVTIPAGASMAKFKDKPIDDSPNSGTLKVKVKLVPPINGGYTVGTGTATIKLVGH